MMLVFVDAEGRWWWWLSTLRMYIKKEENENEDYLLTQVGGGC